MGGEQESVCLVVGLLEHSCKQRPLADAAQALKQRCVVIHILSYMYRQKSCTIYAQ